MSALKGVYVSPDARLLINANTPLFPLKAVHATRSMFRLETDMPQDAHQFIIQTVGKLSVGAMYVDSGTFNNDTIKQGLDLATIQLANMGAA